MSWRRSDFTLERINDILLVEDLNLGGLSVTNDAEELINDILYTFGDVDDMTILYRDSMGRWDQMATKNNRFAGFLPVGARDRDAALAWAMVARMPR